MGLAGRKVKQRIPNDPRNLSWADDAARFGSSYLSKFGWDSSKGLGVGGEGRTSHIKVAQKMDMLGIGAGHQNDPNGIAWKQNKDFENLLKRLNEANETGDGEEREEGTTVDGFIKSKEHLEKDNVEEEKEEAEEKVKKRKRKRDEDGGREKRKERKREHETDKKSKEKDGEGPKALKPTTSRSKSPEPVVPAGRKEQARVVPRHRSHRARHIAAKSLASKSAVAISEILGIAPTPSAASSNTPSGTQTPQEGKLTSISDDNDNTGIERLTTSTKSLQDYFKEKMGKLKGVATKVEGTTGIDYDDVLRGGLGSRSGRVDDEDDAPNMGLSSFPQLKSSSFMAATTLSPAPTPAETLKDEKRRRKEQRAAKDRVKG